MSEKFKQLSEIEQAIVMLYLDNSSLIADYQSNEDISKMIDKLIENNSIINLAYALWANWIKESNSLGQVNSWHELQMQIDMSEIQNVKILTYFKQQFNSDFSKFKQAYKKWLEKNW